MNNILLVHLYEFIHPADDFSVQRMRPYALFFFFNDPATTEIYTLSLHDALPISRRAHGGRSPRARRARDQPARSSSGAGGSGANRRAAPVRPAHRRGSEPPPGSLRPPPRRTRAREPAS